MKDLSASEAIEKEKKEYLAEAMGKYSLKIREDKERFYVFLEIISLPGTVSKKHFPVKYHLVRKGVKEIK